MCLALFSLLVVCTINLANFATVDYVNGVTFENNINGLGNDIYRLSLADQQKREARTAHLSEAWKDNYVVRGEYFYSNEDKLYKVYYVADDNGYRSRIQDISAGVMSGLIEGPLAGGGAGGLSGGGAIGNQSTNPHVFDAILGRGMG